MCSGILTNNLLDLVLVFEEVWVSTDDLDIEVIAEDLGANVFRRSPSNATAISSSIDAVREFLLCHGERSNQS